MSHETTTYQPRERPLIPAGHDKWRAVSRVPIRRMNTNGTDDELIEWLLRAITEPGADMHQRRFDLEALAAIVQRNPRAGFGVAPIDSDTHDGLCVTCGGANDAPIFDGHPYTEAVKEESA